VATLDSTDGPGDAEGTFRTAATDDRPGSVMDGALQTLLDQRGLCMVGVRTILTSDHPLDWGQHGLSIADYRWALTRWEDTIGPGIARGLGRNDLAARDVDSGAAPNRQLGPIYDIMLGDRAIALSPRGDGSFDIIGGNHRVAAAKQLGISQLPVRIRR
jgi:hypothetical protein